MIRIDSVDCVMSFSSRLKRKTGARSKRRKSRKSGSFAMEVGLEFSTLTMLRNPSRSSRFLLR